MAQEQKQEQTLAVVAQMPSESRMALSHRRHGRALERVHDLGRELNSAFQELYAAGLELKDDHGVEIGVKLEPPLSEAWFDWRARRQIADMDGQTRVR